MKREDLLTSSHLVKMGLKHERCGISGADQWQGMPIWTYKGKYTEITFRGTFSHFLLAGYFNSQIKTVGDLVDIIRLVSGEILEIDKLEI